MRDEKCLITVIQYAYRYNRKADELMLIIKGIYDGGQVKLLEPLRMKGRHIVEIRFIEGEFSKERQLNAFRKARGIWKDCPEVDSIFRELDKRWQEWRENLEGSA